MILLLSSKRGITPSNEEGFGGIILDRTVCVSLNGLLKKILGRSTRVGICRAAAYLNNGFQGIADETSSR